MSHAATQSDATRTPRTGGHAIVRVAFLLPLAALFLAGWFSSLPAVNALDAGLRVLAALLFVLAFEYSPRMRPGPVRAALIASAGVLAAGEFAWHIYLSAATDLDTSFAWAYPVALLLMLWDPALTFIRDRRAHRATPAVD